MFGPFGFQEQPQLGAFFPKVEDDGGNGPLGHLGAPMLLLGSPFAFFFVVRMFKPLRVGRHPGETETDISSFFVLFAHRASPFSAPGNNNSKHRREVL